uniref:CRAL-TRIO domain-containing protein n=1 Tax=Steinernema glaseri TaxID=37863 RepID=A0A1I7Y8N9_9BILA
MKDKTIRSMEYGDPEYPRPYHSARPKRRAVLNQQDVDKQFSVAKKRKGQSHLPVVMSHFISSSEITADMRAKIDELKLKCATDLQRYPEYNDDFTLLRWLMGWDFDVDAVVPKLSFCLSTLYALGLHEMNFDSAEDIAEFARSQSATSEYFPGGLMGEDREGNLIGVQCLARAHPKSLALAGRVSEVLRFTIMEGEAAFKIIRKNEAKLGRKLGIKLIVDLAGFSTDLLYAPTLKIYLNLISQLQSMFPDFARSIFVINCPSMLSVAYTAVQPVLSKQTRDKVQFLGADWKEKLAEDLGAENIWPHWGGTKPIPEQAKGKPTGLIRMGGKVPKELRCENNNSWDDDKPMEKLNVPARSVKKVQVEVGPNASRLCWFFKCSSADIDFSIKRDGIYVWPRFRISTEFVPEFGSIDCQEGIYEIESVKKVQVEVGPNASRLCWFFKCSSADIDFSIKRDGIYVWPRFRISTEFVPEFGSIECQKGIYEIEFDNSHGKVWGKDIKYHVLVE